MTLCRDMVSVCYKCDMPYLSKTADTTINAQELQPETQREQHELVQQLSMDDGLVAGGQNSARSCNFWRVNSGCQQTAFNGHTASAQTAGRSAGSKLGLSTFHGQIKYNRIRYSVAKAGVFTPCVLFAPVTV